MGLNAQIRKKRKQIQAMAPKALEARRWLSDGRRLAKTLHDELLRITGNYKAALSALATLLARRRLARRRKRA